MDSYNSQYPLEYYEVGVPYMFYRSGSFGHGSASSLEDISRYGSVLKRTESQEGSGYDTADRAIGVVISRKAAGDKYGVITVMFQGTVNGKTAYMNVKYITNYLGVFCDDKEKHAARGTLDLSGEINVTIHEKRGGGIALDGGRGGGIALDRNTTGGGIALD